METISELKSSTQSQTDTTSPLLEGIWSFAAPEPESIPEPQQNVLFLTDFPETLQIPQPREVSRDNPRQHWLFSWAKGTWPFGTELPSDKPRPFIKNIEDLKTQFGESQEIRQAFATHYEDLSVYSFALCAHRKKIEVDVYKQELSSKARELTAGTELWIRTDEHGIRDTLKEGRIRTSFEMPDPDAEHLDHIAEIEHHLFGYPREGWDPSKRPIYGYLTDRPSGHCGQQSDTLARYGDVAIRLHTSAVSERATISCGDTMADTRPENERLILARPYTLPDYHIFPVENPLRSMDSAKLLRDPLEYTSLHDVPGYIEVQYHGGVSIQDIREIVFCQGRLPASELLQALRSQHIPYRVEKPMPGDLENSLEDQYKIVSDFLDARYYLTDDLTTTLTLKPEAMDTFPSLPNVLSNRGDTRNNNGQGASTSSRREGHENTSDDIRRSLAQEIDDVWTTKFAGFFRSSRQPQSLGGIWAIPRERRSAYWLNKSAITGVRGTNTCVPCSTAMILQEVGIGGIDVDALAAWMGHNSRSGVPLANARLVFDAYNLTSRYTYAAGLNPDRGVQGVAALARMANHYLPCIIGYNFPGNAGSHAFVIDAYKEDDQLFAVRDPAPHMGATTYTFTEILAGWDGTAITDQAMVNWINDQRTAALFR